MKILSKLLLFLIVGHISNMFGQTPPVSTATSNDSVKQKLETIQKSLEDLKKIIEDDKDMSATVGEFNLYKVEDVEVYFCPTGDCDEKKEKTKYKVNVENVIIDIYNGVISDIQVFTKEHKTFTNALAPIEVNKFDRCDLLKYFSGDSIFYIQTCDILYFKRNGNYHADDCRIELKDKDEKKEILKDLGINNIINIRVYSDLLGALGGDENGLIQTEANFKTPLNTSNMYNKPFFWFNNFSTNLRVSKFDNDFKYTSVNYTKEDTTITGNDTIITKPDTSFSRQTLQQRNWFNFDVNLNIFTFYFKNKSKNGFALDVLGGFSLSNFSNKADTFVTILPYLGLNPVLKIIPAPNVGITLMAPAIYQYAPQLDKYSYDGRKYSEGKLLISPELEFFWNPFKVPGSRVFTRVRYSTMQEKEPFVLWQLGCTLSISELINKKLENN